MGQYVRTTLLKVSFRSLQDVGKLEWSQMPNTYFSWTSVQAGPSTILLSIQFSHGWSQITRTISFQKSKLRSGKALTNADGEICQSQ